MCDVKGRFLDVTIGHPGSTSDYLAFVTSNLHAKLEFFTEIMHMHATIMWLSPLKMCPRGVKTHVTSISPNLESELNTRSACWCTDGPF